MLSERSNICDFTQVLKRTPGMRYQQNIPDLYEYNNFTPDIRLDLTKTIANKIYELNKANKCIDYVLKITDICYTLDLICYFHS